MEREGREPDPVIEIGRRRAGHLAGEEATPSEPHCVRPPAPRIPIPPCATPPSTPNSPRVRRPRLHRLAPRARRRPPRSRSRPPARPPGEIRKSRRAPSLRRDDARHLAQGPRGVHEPFARGAPDEHPMARGAGVCASRRRRARGRERNRALTRAASHAAPSAARATFRTGRATFRQRGSRAFSTVLGLAPLMLSPLTMRDIVFTRDQLTLPPGSLWPSGRRCASLHA
jgi:hypothetical protein